MESYIGQIQAFGFNFAPRAWAKCEGQLLAINANQALFSLLGTTYGGDGRTTFGLPDLRGRSAIGYGNGPGLSNYPIGAKGGVETVTLNTNQIPAHGHGLNVAAEGVEEVKPAGNTLAAASIYTSHAPDAALHANSVGNAGGNQHHENRSPYLAINWCICLTGIFPSRN